jgi:endonuclease III
MELETDIKKLIDYINKVKSSGSFKIIKKVPPSEDPADEHIGAIIVDATLSARHNYENQVRKRVENLKKKYPAASTTSSFLQLINSVGLEELLMGWEKNSTEKSKQKQVKETAQFFARSGIEVFANLAVWIQKEENRRKLKSEVSGIGDKTADYYGVLACDPEAVAIDERISNFLYNAGIDEKRYSYRKKQVIVQEAARRMGYTPLDLEQSIWHHNPKRKREGEKMDKDNKEPVLEVSLPPDKKRQLDDVAKEYGQEPAVLASIWVIDRLLQLGSAKPMGWPTETPELPVASESLEDAKVRLAKRYIHDQDEDCLFLQAKSFKEWANYIAGFVLTQRGKTPFTPKDIKQVLRDELIPQHYGRSRAQENELLTADVRVNAPGNRPGGFPCLEQVRRGAYRFIGFRKGIESRYGRRDLEERLSKCRME